MKISKELMDRLTNFLFEAIGGKVVDGITYTMEISPEDDEAIKNYLELKDMVVKEGFKNNEVFRVYNVANGYIFDMDLAIVRYLNDKVFKAVSKNTGLNCDGNAVIGYGPEVRRKQDMESLAKYCISQFESNKTEFEVALFSRNSVPRITISGKDSAKGSQGKGVVVTYNAYAIRHWDIEEINNRLLIPKGLRITRIKPCEILPSKTGMRFVLSVGRAR